jgi:hypothetical protein
MPRLPDWSRRLMEWADQARKEPLAWGETDCALTGAAAVAAQRGAHPAPELVGRYRTEAKAAAYLRRNGGLVAVVTRFMGPPLADPREAGRGDPVAFLDEGTPKLGVCFGEVVMARDAVGLASRPMGRLAREGALLAAWRT